MVYRLIMKANIIWAVVFIAACSSVGAIRNITANVGERVTLKCHTQLDEPVEWTYHQNSLLDQVHKDIVLDGILINGNKKYFELNTTRRGHYDLVIRTAATNNTGYYTCTEEQGLGTKHSFHLSVVDASAVDTILATKSQVGQRTTLKCHTELTTDVIWTYRKSLYDANHRDLVLDGEVINGNKVKYELQRSATGDCDLVIKRVTMDNNGFYTCTEDQGLGRQHHNYLYVFGETVTRGRPHETRSDKTVDTPKQPQHPCQRDEYYDELEEKCISCRDVCVSLPMLCLLRCPDYTTNVESVTSLSAQPSSAGPIIPIVVPVVVCLAVVFATLAVVVFVVIYRRRQTNKQTRSVAARQHFVSPTMTSLVSKSSTCHSDPEPGADNANNHHAGVRMYIGDEVIPEENGE